MTAVHRVLDPAKGKQVMPGLCALAVMTKAPKAGRVKTRLTPPLAPEEAAALNTCFLRDTATSLAAVMAMVIDLPPAKLARAPQALDSNGARASVNDLA